MAAFGNQAVHIGCLGGRFELNVCRGLITSGRPISMLMSYRFRWAQCQLDAIAPLRSVKAIRQALTRLPTGLEATYSRILSAVAQYARQIMRRALEWISFSFHSHSLNFMKSSLLNPALFTWILKLDYPSLWTSFF
jgi:hypothetical protein